MTDPTTDTTANVLGSGTTTSTATATTTTTSEENYVVSLESERRTFAPGDDVFVLVQLRSAGETKPPTPSKTNLVRGSVALVGEERTLISFQGKQLEGSVAIFEPVVVYLEGSTIPRWRVCLKLPQDVPPSCELGAIPPCGTVMYVVTARLSIGKVSVSASNRIRVVSSRAMYKTKPADVEGVVLDSAPMWSIPLCLPGSFTTSKDAPEWRVLIPNKTSFRPGEHVKYRTTIRGNGPRGSSSTFNRVDGLRVSIRRQRWFSDGHGHDVPSLFDMAKPPQTVDFTGSAAGALPVDFEGSITIPLGIAPTTRGSLMSNEYDLVLELMKGKTVRGTVDIPLTVYRDVEGALISPSFSPHLRGLKYSAIVDSALGGPSGNNTTDEEDEEEDDDNATKKKKKKKKSENRAAAPEEMQELVLT